MNTSFCRKLRIMMLGKKGSEQNSILLTRVFKEMGHEVILIPFPGSSTEVILKNAEVSQPDIIMQMGGRRAQIEHLEKLKEKGFKIVLWYADAYGLSTKTDERFFSNVKKSVDLVFVSVKGLVYQLKEYGVNAVWVPQYYDNVYYAPSVKRLERGQAIFDICFIGHRSDLRLKREDYIREINNYERWSFRICGLGYRFKTEPVFGTAMADLYASTKIALNFLYTLNPCELQMSDRIFKAMGCGALFMTPPIQGIEQMFIPGVHFVEWNNMNDLYKKIDYYVNHDYEREVIARAGQEEVLKKHTIYHKVKIYEKYFYELAGDRINKQLKSRTKFYV